MTLKSLEAIIAEPSPENIRLAASLLKKDEVIGIPTETVYGLGGLISSELAISRIFSVKERPRFDPLIVHIPELAKPSLRWLSERKWIDIESIDKNAQASIEKLMHTFWPGPLTLVLPKHSRISDLVTSGLGSVALRMPSHPVFQALLNELNEGIAAPSANRFGRVSPVTAGDVKAELGTRIPMILEGGQSAIGVESTVIEYSLEKEFRLLRPGGLARERIEMILGRPLLHVESSSRPDRVLSPGMLDSHYAPEKQSIRLIRPIRALSDAELKWVVSHLKQLQPEMNRLSLLTPHGSNAEAASRLQTVSGLEIQRIELSLQASDLESARNLFAALREFDRSESTLLLIEPVEPLSGLFLAIDDRLKRASRPLPI